MKKIVPILLCAFAGFSLFGCGSEFTVGKDVKIEDITEFYYTCENINYNANYLRYRFYVEDEKHMFYVERRERPGDYGPATEDDITLQGSFELTDEEWEAFFDCLKEGTVEKRKEHLETGDSGPWTFLYWKKDKGDIQEFTFASVEARFGFEELCEGLEERLK